MLACFSLLVHRHHWKYLDIDFNHDFSWNGISYWSWFRYSVALLEAVHSSTILTKTGIGRQTALLLVRQGCSRIAIADINEPGVAETGEAIAKINKNAEILDLHLGSRPPILFTA